MLLSLSLIFLTGLLFSGLCKKARLPGLLGMLISGILLGPYALNWIDGSVLSISSELRRMALIAVMAMGTALLIRLPIASRRLSGKLNALWTAAEVLLFTLVGAGTDIRCALTFGGRAVLLIFLALLFRMCGTALCLMKTRLAPRERLFCMLAYLPKATVQAAIGGVPLAMGLPCGAIVLTVAVLAILITAPLGAFLIDNTYKRFLTRKDGSYAQMD